ncbi:MAG: hypothetical protein ABFD45_02260 [Smithella sp.]|jgi:hypothetical protein
MKIALLGTCRLGSIRRHFDCTDFDEAISFVHSTKEIIQILKYITNQIAIPDDINQFCFRRGILSRQPVFQHERFVSQFNEADLFVIEVCAMRKYIYEGFYMHHLAVDRRLHYHKETPKRILENTLVQYQDRQEIEEDIADIQSIVFPRDVLLVSHINAKIDTSASRSPYVAAAKKAKSAISSFLSNKKNDGENGRFATIGKRAELISLLRQIAQEKGIAFFDPTVVFSGYSQEQILEPELPGLPPGHYTDFGEKIMGHLFAEEIRKICSRD